jgi:pyridoxine 4-dehydrogenase
VEESLGVIARLQQECKIRHVGLSEVKPVEIEQAQKILPIVSVQNLYNIGNGSHEDTLEFCEKHNIAFIPWFPVGAGEFAKAGGPLDTAAKRHGVSVAEIAMPGFCTVHQ